ncbi:MAG: alpha/beta hydrolase [Leadbetterella sp.]|nr:alpha/beta hydrolase [Leadbetterella sp.]
MTKRILKAILKSILTLLLVIFLYEQASQLYFNSKKPSAAEFVDIDGVPTHFVKKGKGGPTVVFQSGLGGDYKTWEAIQDSVSRFTTTLSYDRTGLQWSGPSKSPKTLESMTRELEILLEKTGCPKPYILVGHSLSGLTLRPFIQRHKQDISGVIFLDVSHPEQVKRSSEELKKYLVVPPQGLVAALVESGWARIYFSFRPFISDVPGSHPMNKHITNYFYRSYKTVLQEAREDDLMFNEAGKINSFGSVPLTVITGAYPQGTGFLEDPALENEYLEIHRSGQKDLLRLSAQSKQIIAPNSGHYVPLTDESLVINAILESVGSR